MLDFNFTHNPKQFKFKAKEIADEITSILYSENIEIVKNNGSISINENYSAILPPDLFNALNNLYYTIRFMQLTKHEILKKYLPETRKLPLSEFLFADFFSGVGGLSRGLVNAGFQPAFVNDHYLAALETYYFNHTLPVDRFYIGDIQNLVDKVNIYLPMLKNIKLVVGGPPCQSFSTANRWQSLADDPRNELYRYFLKMLNIIQPEWFIMENVTGMKRMEDQIEKDILAFTHSNYHFTTFILNAKDFGVPQNRKRYFIVGSRTKTKQQIESIKLNLKLKSIESKKFTLGNALCGLPALKTNPFKNKTNYESETNGYKILKQNIDDNEFLKWINNGLRSNYICNHKSRYNNDNDITIFGLLNQGENSTTPSIQPFNLYKNRDRIFKDKYFKLAEESYCKTITSHMKHDCHMYIHPTQARGLSPREAARIQTFPDDYFFRGSINDWYKQIGNAVPVKLAEIIGKEIMKLYN